MAVSEYGSAEEHHESMTMELLDLPYTVFLDIICHLPAVDALRCRVLSKAAHAALTRQDLSISLILYHFPRSREGRFLRQSFSDGNAEHVRSYAQQDWSDVFARLARRYFHLANAMPWRVNKVEVLKDADRLRGVTPWNKFLRLDNKTAPFHYWEPTWTYSSRDGLLVYPDSDGLGYQLRDLETRLDVEVPFNVAGKVVRRVRLSDGLLVFEWCEETAHHPLNAEEAAHRHFATAYDVTPAPPSSWAVRFRSEWKIHFLGLPLSHHDRFFSTHNATHYVVYIWQPTRSPWGEDAPLERLVVWDIRGPSLYRPSLDPCEREKPGPDASGPRVIRRLTNGELDAWGIRQNDTPALRGLAIDACTWDAQSESACGHVFIHEEEHRWSAGPHSSANQPRLHRVKSTGIPLEGEGPRWVDECGGGGSGADEGSNDVGTAFCWRGPRARSSSLDWDRSLDEAGGEETETWPGRTPCWRHDDFPYLTVSEVFDAASGVRISARQCFMLETLSVHVRPKLRVAGVDAAHSVGGRSGGSSTSTSNRSRSSSGVSIDVEEEEESSDEDNDDAEEEQEEWRPRGAGTRIEGPGGDEVQFADDMWGELLEKGFICGDERRLLGEDRDGNITIVQF